MFLSCKTAQPFLEEWEPLVKTTHRTLSELEGRTTSALLGAEIELGIAQAA